MFSFIEFDDLRDNEIKLIAKSHDESGYAPRYGFSIALVDTDEEVGVVFFILDTSRKQYLRGHLSYGVSSAHTGHNYAAKACRLIKKVAVAHGFKRLFIGAGYDNIASIKTIEKLGAALITAGDVPDEGILEELRAERTHMYVWGIGE